MERHYEWYETVDGDEDLLQGDFVQECPIVIPDPSVPLEPSREVPMRILNYNVVVMSQSCDIVQRKIDLILVCPIWPLGEFANRSENGFFKSTKGKEELRKGNVPGYHLLNKCELDGYKTDLMVVDFRSVYSVALDLILELARRRGRRLRLLPPYREHLSQAFARFFMRVGLPVDIPQFR